MRSDPLFLAWQAGHRYDPADRASWWDEWWQLTADTVARGVSMRRARVVFEPVSEYVRFEYDLTFMNVGAGEDVRWLPRRRASDLVLPGNDFWLFDEETVAFNHFTGDGEFTGMEISDAPELAKLCLSAFASVWDRAVPHEDYRPA